MDARPYSQHNLRRAAEERRKADRALTEEARRTHLDLAEIFEARAGLAAIAAADASNVIQLRPVPAPKPAARPRRQPARSRTSRAAPRAG